MSVMSCCRKGCENIMCDHYSYEFGYICRECLEELKEFRPECEQDIKFFMENNRRYLTSPPNVLDVDSIFTVQN